MIPGQKSWIDLLNAQESWTTDDSMLAVIPDGAREFESAEKWPRLKALAFLNNNAQALRVNYLRLEQGETLDLDLLNPVLDGISLRIVNWRAVSGAKERFRDDLFHGRLPSAIDVAVKKDGWNLGTAHIRQVVQRAVMSFARYVELRLCDSSYPGATPGMFRVLKCVAPSCTTLLPCAGGVPEFCSDACATDTGEL